MTRSPGSHTVATRRCCHDRSNQVIRGPQSAPRARVPDGERRSSAPMWRVDSQGPAAASQPASPSAVAARSRHARTYEGPDTKPGLDEGRTGRSWGSAKQIRCVVGLRPRGGLRAPGASSARARGVSVRAPRAIRARSARGLHWGRGRWQRSRFASKHGGDEGIWRAISVALDVVDDQVRGRVHDPVQTQDPDLRRA